MPGRRVAAAQRIRSPAPTQANIHQPSREKMSKSWCLFVLFCFRVFQGLSWEHGTFTGRGVFIVIIPSRPVPWFRGSVKLDPLGTSNVVISCGVLVIIRPTREKPMFVCSSSLCITFKIKKKPSKNGPPFALDI